RNKEQVLLRLLRWSNVFEELAWASEAGLITVGNDHWSDYVNWVVRDEAGNLALIWGAVAANLRVCLPELELAGIEVVEGIPTHHEILNLSDDDHGLGRCVRDIVVSTVGVPREDSDLEIDESELNELLGQSTLEKLRKG
ncbi:MAG: hypothetical protein ABIC96_03250, partial [Patescibacteria group bacterium]